jgi:predicted permease
MDTGTIVQLVALAVGKLVICIGLGAICYRQLNRAGKVEQSLIKQATQVNVNVFIPLFIFSKCSQGLTLELVTQLAFVPVVIGCFIVIGCCCGEAAVRITCGPRSCAPIARVTCMFTNVIGLPLPLVLSIAASVPSTRDDPTAADRVTSYLFLCNIVASMTMWSFAGRLLQPSRAMTQPMLSAGNPSSSDEAPPETPSAATKAGCGGDSVSSTSAIGYSGAAVSPAVEMMPGSGGDADRIGSSSSSSSSSGTNGGGGGTGPSSSSRPAATRSVGTCCKGFYKGLNRPTMASFFGALVGVTPVRAWVVPTDAPLRWVLDAFDMIGTAGIPLLLFLLGATLSKGVGGTGQLMPLRSLIACVAAKLLLVPALNLLLILAALRFQLFPTVDPVLLPLALLAVAAAPAAMNLSSISQMALPGAGAQVVAAIVFWQYILSVLTVSIWMTAGLLIFHVQ